MKKINRPKFHALKAYLDENNINYDEVANMINISLVSFNRKINGQSAWVWDEMVLIKNGLKFDKETFMNIFFNQQVTEM